MFLTVFVLLINRGDIKTIVFTLFIYFVAIFFTYLTMLPLMKVVCVAENFAFFIPY